MSPPGMGAGPVGLRVTATDQRFAPYEFSAVFTGIGDSMLIMGLYGAYPEVIDDLAHRAADKASQGLGTGGKPSGA